MFVQVCINLVNLDLFLLNIESHELFLPICYDEPLILIKDDLFDESQINILSFLLDLRTIFMDNRGVNYSPVRRSRIINHEGLA